MEIFYPPDQPEPSSQLDLGLGAGSPRLLILKHGADQTTRPDKIRLWRIRG